MSEVFAATLRRNAFRFALTGLSGVWLSGCADATRFSDAGNPFSNPFGVASNDAATPTPRVSSTPLAAGKPYNSNYAAAPAKSPATYASAPPTPESTGAIRHVDPVGGSATGWTAVGGSPVVVGAADDAAGLSARYGVPEAALLSANGLHSRSELHANMRIVIPVYNARVAKADEDHGDKDKSRRVAKRDSDDESKSVETEHKKHKASKKDDDADADDDGAKKKLAKLEKTKKAEKSAKADDEKDAKKAEKLAKADKVKADKAEKAAPEVAKAEPAKNVKKPETDKTPIGDVAAAGSDEASKFRWPARGRIIQGFKSGGNDGINIALPEGTSVRAAEDGKVAYAGSALKGYGNLVLIRHTNGYVTAYANNGELDVKSGDTVKRGQVIAKSGQTGDVSTPQLHFEVRKGQTPVDPTGYLAGL